VALRGNAASTRRHRQVVKMLIVVLGLFVICRGPWHLADIIIDAVVFDDEDASNGGLDLIRQLATVLVFINSWMTPVIYAMFNIRIREQLLNSFRCHPQPKGLQFKGIKPMVSCFRISRVTPAADTTDTAAAAVSPSPSPGIRIAVIVLANE
jgi:hypothetical protein